MASVFFKLLRNPLHGGAEVGRDGHLNFSSRTWQYQEACASQYAYAQQHNVQSMKNIQHQPIVFSQGCFMNFHFMRCDELRYLCHC